MRPYSALAMHKAIVGIVEAHVAIVERRKDMRTRHFTTQKRHFGGYGSNSIVNRDDTECYHIRWEVPVRSDNTQMAAWIVRDDCYAVSDRDKIKHVKNTREQSSLPT